jgi:hypothetical protein
VGRHSVQEPTKTGPRGSSEPKLKWGQIPIRGSSGHSGATVRVFTGRPGDPEARPTRKGLILRPET